MSRDCKRPDTIDRNGSDCADPTCRAHQHNEDGPYAAPARMACGCPAGARDHTCGRLQGEYDYHPPEACPDRGCCLWHAVT